MGTLLHIDPNLIPTYFSFSTSDFTASEDGLFTDLPFTVVTMDGQDKNENMLQALEINQESRPYFPHLVFYVCLAIIKKNTYDATKGSLVSECILTLPKKVSNHFTPPRIDLLCMKNWGTQWTIEISSNE